MIFSIKLNNKKQLILVITILKEIFMSLNNNKSHVKKLLVAVVLFLATSLTAFSQEICGPSTVTLGSTHTYTIKNLPSPHNFNLGETHWGWYHNNSYDIVCVTGTSITITFTDLEMHTVEAELGNSNNSNVYEFLWLDVTVVP